MKDKLTLQSVENGKEVSKHLIYCEESKSPSNSQQECEASNTPKVLDTGFPLSTELFLLFDTTELDQHNNEHADIDQEYQAEVSHSSNIEDNSIFDPAAGTKEQSVNHYQKQKLSDINMRQTCSFLHTNHFCLLQKKLGFFWLKDMSLHKGNNPKTRDTVELYYFKALLLLSCLPPLHFKEKQFVGPPSTPHPHLPRSSSLSLTIHQVHLWKPFQWL